jgi:hypothetical protein
MNESTNKCKLLATLRSYLELDDIAVLPVLHVVYYPYRDQ